MLRGLASANEYTRQSTLAHLDDRGLQAAAQVIGECVCDDRQRTAPLVRETMQEHCDLIRQITNHKFRARPLAQKRRLLIQLGGGLDSILQTSLPEVAKGIEASRERMDEKLRNLVAERAATAAAEASAAAAAAPKPKKKREKKSVVPAAAAAAAAPDASASV
jgi:hypothetical protein